MKPRLLNAAVLVLTLGLAASPTAVSARAAAATPLVPGSSPAGSDTTRRPASMYLGEISGSTLTGARGRIQWKSWGRTRAVGIGIEKINTCTPDCAAGNFERFPVQIVLSVPQLIHGALMFKDLRLHYTQRKPAGGLGKQTQWVDTYQPGVGGGPAVRLWFPASS